VYKHSGGAGNYSNKTVAPGLRNKIYKSVLLFDCKQEMLWRNNVIENIYTHIMYVIKNLIEARPVVALSSLHSRLVKRCNTQWD